MVYALNKVQSDDALSMLCLCYLMEVHVIFQHASILVIVLVFLLFLGFHKISNFCLLVMVGRPSSSLHLMQRLLMACNQSSIQNYMHSYSHRHLSFLLLVYKLAWLANTFLFIGLIPLVLPTPTHKAHVLIVWWSRSLRMLLNHYVFIGKRG